LFHAKIAEIRPNQVANWTFVGQFRSEAGYSGEVFGDPGIWRQDFQNFSPLIFLRVGVVNHRICVGDHLDCVLTTRTTNPDLEWSVTNLRFWKSKANESTQNGQLKSATLMVMEHLLDEVGRKNGEHGYSRQHVLFHPETS
jgi:hypothetical protein